MKRYDDLRDETATSLHEQRLESVVRALLQGGVKTVLDLGCGGGELLLRLAREPLFNRITGIDIAPKALSAAHQLLSAAGHLGENRRLALQLASFTCSLSDFAEYQGAVLLETIEHIEPGRLSVVEKSILCDFRPKILVVTTPNADYNPLYGLAPGVLRHADHRFEWSRFKFRKWACGAAARNGYRAIFTDIGPADPDLGSPSQMAVFTLV